MMLSITAMIWFGDDGLDFSSCFDTYPKKCTSSNIYQVLDLDAHLVVRHFCHFPHVRQAQLLHCANNTFCRLHAISHPVHLCPACTRQPTKTTTSTQQGFSTHRSQFFPSTPHLSHAATQPTHLADRKS